MKRIGLLFPGQGSQYVGMGKEMYDNFPQAKSVYDNANEVLGFDLKKIVFEGPEETLKQTQYTQPAIFTSSIAIFDAFRSRYDVSGDTVLCAGHSLGEYSALCASGAFSLADGLKLVKARGEFIQKASQANPGTMAAIIGLGRDKLTEVCAKAKDMGVCEPVNYNTSEQIVIAGATEAVKKAVELARVAGAAKAVMLAVSGPFHSSLMKQAAELMNEELKKYQFSNMSFKVITNCDAQLTENSEKVKDKLVRQINSPVLWEDSIRAMINSGIEIFIELGPQRVLSGLMRRIDKTKKCLNIEDMKSLEKTLEELTK
ncbi:MAG: ACP S-malonyltransferase [Endomicrobiales bacterium]|nr:ACP S-malonyltransferase [Endomicrobiales bacterium]